MTWSTRFALVAVAVMVAFKALAPAAPFDPARDNPRLDAGNQRLAPDGCGLRWYRQWRCER